MKARRGVERGRSLVEVLAALAIGALGVAAATPAVEALRESGRAEAGARHLAGLLSAQRWRSVARHRHRGFLFERRGGGWTWQEIEDGNGNGLRTREVRSGVDTRISPPRRLEHQVATATLGIPPGGPYPEIPPRRGLLRQGDDPVRFGVSDIVSFSPLGSASSGTIYVTDGRGGLCGVVLFGPTARLRVWRFDRRERRWRL